METPQQQALYLDGVFHAHGLTLRREGRSVTPGDDAVGEFRSIAEKFAADGHDVLLKALGVLPETAKVGQRPSPPAIAGTIISKAIRSAG